jgi:hypothetical protein
MASVAAIQIGAPLLILGLASFVWFLVVLIDMARRPTWQWRQAASNKPMWIVLEVAMLLLFGPLSIISGLIHWLAARPKLVAAERSGEVTGGYGSAWGGGSYPPPRSYEPPSSSYGSTAPTETHGSGSSGGELSSGPPAYPGTQVPPAGSPPGSPPGAVSTPPSWQPDPAGRHEYRYWDGTSWTEHVSDSGEQTTDPLT